jgi:hypothetical protein
METLSYLAVGFISLFLGLFVGYKVGATKIPPHFQTLGTQLPSVTPEEKKHKGFRSESVKSDPKIKKYNLN